MLTITLGEGNGNPLQYSCLENPMDRGAWWAVVHGVTKSRTLTEQLHFHFHALEKEMATHSSILAWRIPGTAEPGGLQYVGSHRVGHDWSDLAAAALLLCARHCSKIYIYIFIYDNIPHLTLKTALQGTHYYYHFSCEETKFQREKDFVQLQIIRNRQNFDLCLALDFGLFNT